MNIFIDNRSGAPIYDQIYNQIKDMIICGSLAANEPLPSIRTLAKDLRISVVTTKRAYDELEREGYIYTLPAKGCFVAAQNTEMLKEHNLKLIEEHMNEIRKLAALCKLSKEDIIDMFDIIDELE
ncbi:MAG: GntR family transcriptional regulator [Ruminococcus sp.]|uniref:GntR family transcriptional regulator n=1 Tax=Ruminococcus sp. TaxID=41978 RepID=UPI0025DEC57C|nr:GntR family transcriptional regulator [Ruminococcus sp.]MBR5682633.1 GntR family transcriptional regulator [Ruminococcus sp.]